MMRLTPRYVRTRLTVWYVLVLGALLIVSAVGASSLMVLQMRSQLKRRTVQDLETVEGLLYFDRAGQLRFNEEYHNHPESKLVQDRYLEILSPVGAELYRNAHLGKLVMESAVFPGEGIGGYSERSIRLSDGTPVILASRQHRLDGQTILIRLAYSEAPISDHLRQFWIIFLAALPITLASAALAGFAMANRALRPIRVMVQQTERITTERLHARLPVENNDELGDLARVVNQMLSRIEQSFEQLRRFTSDASHELRTPLAAMRAVGEVGLQNRRTSEEYREIIGSMLEEISRLTNLVDMLLMLARADSGQVPLRLEVFAASEVMKEAANLIETLVEEKHQTLMMEVDEGILLRGDRLVLRQAAINILHNAVKFTPVGGLICARVSCEGPCVNLSVTDSGPGIPNEHLARVFDRFYRVDPAVKAHEANGSGLGLSIAQWAAKVHDGEIGLSPAAGGGCTFWIRIPIFRQTFDLTRNF